MTNFTVTYKTKKGQLRQKTVQATSDMEAAEMVQKIKSPPYELLPENQWDELRNIQKLEHWKKPIN